MQSLEMLIKKFIPENYQISIDIDKFNHRFFSKVIISGKSQPNISSIDLHSKDLSIASVAVDDKPAEFTISGDILSIKTNDIVAGNHVIAISHSGLITDAMHGIYSCHFEHDGTKKELIATQFESHHAREAFPCIDEPAAKATFDLTIISEKNNTVLSNMPAKATIYNGDRQTTTFETTPKMSTYLLAWVIGELHKKSAKTKNGVDVSIWATQAQSAASLDFALDIAVRTIEFYDQYFQTPYPLSKCDHVALPDFSSGAMENWGLITYREIALLADPSTSSLSSKRYIATVIAHELSHQWFGNLVTMAWWNDLWLNESFASLVEFTAIDAIEPEWHIWHEFYKFDCVAALKRDSIDGIQPVQIDISHPDEIGSLFDGAIVYAKGARLLQMLRTYIGEDDFQDGLQQYFKKFAYKNTTANDLWQILSEVAKINVASLMTPWLTQPGYPVLRVERTGKFIKLTQNKLSGLMSKPSNSLWPITLNTNCPNAPMLLINKEIEFEADTNQSIRFNIGNNAHFITHYDDGLFDLIINSIKNNELSVIDRQQILNEQLILANMGIISSTKIISLLDAYKNETDESVWDMIGLAINNLKMFVYDDDKSEKQLKKLAGNLARSQFCRLGWDQKINEPEADTKLRPIIIGMMMFSEDQAVISEAKGRYHNSNIEDLNPELRSLIISATVRYNNSPSITDELIRIYSTTNSADLKQDICSAITDTQDPKVIDQLLGLLKKKKTIRLQDIAHWVIYLMRNKIGRDPAWQWIRQNWQWIDTNFGNDKSYEEYPRYAASCLLNQKQLTEYKEFFLPMKTNQALTRVIDVGINELKNRVAIIERDKVKVREFLNNL